MDNTTFKQFLNMGDGNIIGSYNKTYNMSDEDAEIMHWLSPLEPQDRHQRVRADRLDGVGDWVLETNEFREWKGGEGGVDDAVLLCYGNPGVGKTYLSSLVIDNLCDWAGKKGIAVAVVGFYCDFLAQREQMITNMMGAILKQLIRREGIPMHVRQAFQKGKGEFGGRGLRLAELMGMLKTTIAALPQIFICIDALDECLPKNLPELLKLLEDIIRESPRTRVFLTGRSFVRVDVQRIFTRATIIPISPKTDDIKSYLEMKLDRDCEPEAMSDALRADILRVIPEKISEIFLLVSLNIDAILGEVTIRQRRKKLDEMTQGNGLSDAYAATVARLKAQKGIKGELGLKVLMWVSHSERPLCAEELCHALGVEIGSSDLDHENVPALRTLLACSLGLVTVETSHTVRLVHYTLQEYLLSHQTLFNRPHSAIAEVCLTYLDSCCIRDLSPTLRGAPAKLPLLEYASHYWGNHARKEVTENVKTLALRVLDGFDRHISAQLMLLRYGEPWFDGREGPKGFTGLHGAAFLGIPEILAALFEMKRWDVNATDSMGNTALAWAARRGHEAEVKILLDKEEVNPNTLSDYKTPLSWASMKGHEGVVKLILARRNVNINTPDTKCGLTPLSWAAEEGHEGVFKMFLNREDTNPNTVNHKGHTLLSLAAMGGHEGVVKLLLEREDLNINTSDAGTGLTPLSWAAMRGHERVVKLLLERKDLNINTSDTKTGLTPLSWAAMRGHERVVKLLLEREDVNINLSDTIYGQTPLFCAAEEGHVGVVKLLLAREDVSINLPDTISGKTPLFCAAGAGHEEVAKMLLDHKDINPNVVDDEGRTALLLASWNGREGVVKLLLEREDVNINPPDTNYGQSALSWAAGKGHEGVVKMLLDHKDINPNVVDDKGRTALLLASWNGREGVVKLLLEREDVNINPPDTKYGQSALSWAAEEGHEGVVKMLLDHKDINPNVVDDQGRTALLQASWWGHEGVVKLLLAREDVNINTLDTKFGQPALLWAAEEGHGGIVKMLLDHKDINPNVVDDRGQTALLLASRKGHEGVVKLLLEKENVIVNTPAIKFGQPALSWAAEKGHEGVVRMLLDHKDINPNIVDDEGHTPLSLAAMRGHEGVVKLLLERDDVNINTADYISYLTPLSWAADKGHEGVVKMLLNRENINPIKGQTALSRVSQIVPEGGA